MPAVTLYGGGGNETFQMKGLPVTPFAIHGGGTNTLDYSAYTGDVTVDLPLGFATGLGGGISNIQNVTGSDGNDLLVGDGNANVLVGGTGRNVLIGGGADALGRLPLGCLLAGRRPARQQRPGQKQRGTLRPGHLAFDRAACPRVVAAQVQQAIVGGLAQPQAEGHRPAGQEVVQAAGRLQLGFLDHVGRIEPGAQARVEVRLDEGAQGRAVTGEQPFEGRRVALREAFEQTARLGGVGLDVGHG
jgi:Ca2+-binding RTX toxin-like protein